MPNYPDIHNLKSRRATFDALVYLAGIAVYAKAASEHELHQEIQRDLKTLIDKVGVDYIHKGRTPAGELLRSHEVRAAELLRIKYKASINLIAKEAAKDKALLSYADDLIRQGANVQLVACSALESFQHPDDAFHRFADYCVDQYGADKAQLALLDMKKRNLAGNIQEMEKFRNQFCISMHFHQLGLLLAQYGHLGAATHLLSDGASPIYAAYGAVLGGQKLFAEELRQEHQIEIPILIVAAMEAKQYAYAKDLAEELNRHHQVDDVLSPKHSFHYLAYLAGYFNSEERVIDKLLSVGASVACVELGRHDAKFRYDKYRHQNTDGPHASYKDEAAVNIEQLRLRRFHVSMTENRETGELLIYRDLSVLTGEPRNNSYHQYELTQASFVGGPKACLLSLIGRDMQLTEESYGAFCEGYAISKDRKGLYNEWIRALAKAGKVDYAFLQCHRFGAHYGALAKGCDEGRHFSIFEGGRFGRVWQAYARLRDTGDKAFYNTLGREEKNQVQNMLVMSVLDQGNIEAAEKHAPRNAKGFFYDSYIYAAACRWPAYAVRLVMQRAPERGGNVAKNTFNALLKGCAAAGDAEQLEFICHQFKINLQHSYYMFDQLTQPGGDEVIEMDNPAYQPPPRVLLTMI